MIRAYLPLAAGFGLTGVALGAFAAHGLKASLSAEYLAIFQTAVLYQLIHALALFGVALLSLHAPGRLLRAAGALFAIGVVLFSGSLYLLTLTGIGKLGIVTPLGGTAFLAGWLCLGLAGWRLPRRAG
ncbi:MULTISPECIES: DUF423 domain-containing protein [Pseudomonadaceae]|uniref:DUF423 domain-containing protein n=1 Tax=Stutzerimonas degradans TaxID=2968968 RepID=A0A8E2QBN5_9GAMM|nr:MULTISPECIES: DUF423 domain-containing protein [Pseudomonadaceae]MCQ4276399.1 DUF423 domain-containing protein [Stutzerimonas degradans]PNF75842.1 DUF423 domain-containing protein [Stutzerimonas degradans]QPT20669.1 DUF423 domain-containing protein [Stutzerimonas degradans]UIP86198.1 DUF423 domain-containing protein [Pseudomonas phenolilytica]